MGSIVGDAAILPSDPKHATPAGSTAVKRVCSGSELEVEHGETADVVGAEVDDDTVIDVEPFRMAALRLGVQSETVGTSSLEWMSAGLESLSLRMRGVGL